MSKEERNIDSLVGDGSDGDRRAFSQVLGVRHRVQGMRAFVVIMCVVGAALVGWMIYRKVIGQQTDPTTQTQQALDALPTYRFSTDPQGVLEAPSAPATSAPVAAPAVAAGHTPSNSSHAPTPEELAYQRRLNAQGQNLGSDDGASLANNVQRVSAPGARGGSDQGVSTQSTAMVTKMTGVGIGRVMAGTFQHPSLTVEAGRMIQCGTTQELDTTVPGMIGCTVSQDVYSFDGKVRLIDKGAHVVGEASGGIKSGQARVFALWTRLTNPDGVTVTLSSPGTNALGSAGIPGQVDSHFWARFGPAIAISIISDIGDAGVQYAANSASSGSTSISLDNTTNTSDSMAREALSATLNIPPTLYDQQGDHVAIYVRQDLDFSDVYQLSRSGSR